MADHISGPWEVFCNDYDGSLEVICGEEYRDDYGNEINKSIAFVCGEYLAAEWDLQITDVEARANARLIAAAPEMYELLREIFPPKIESIEANAASRYWLCPDCGIVPAKEVTNDEFHKKCGASVMWVEGKWLERVRNIFKQIDG